MVTLIAASIMLAATGAADACAGLLPAPPARTVPRPITTRDLVGLRDIGYPDASEDEASPLELSPDGTRLAFVITRAEPDTNQVCRALVVLPLAAHAAPYAVDRGGEVPIERFEYRGMLVPTGFPALSVPAWSPDGRSLAYLRQEAGIAQLWVAHADGSGARAVTRLPVSAERVAWTADGKRLVYTTRPDAPRRERDIDEEGLTGWRYDDRVTPDVSMRPNLVARTIPLETFSIDPTGSDARPASPGEIAGLPAVSELGLPIRRDVQNDAGWRATTEPVNANPGSPTRLVVTTPTGRRIPCAAASCVDGIINIWWGALPGSLVFQRHEGWNKEDNAFYRWTVGTRQPRLILRTRDAVTGCVSDRTALLCGRENATQPRRLVRISLTDGRSRPLFDPNPEFANIQLGRVERFHWTTDKGLPAWGDLALPPGYGGHARLPLVIVVYRSRGFLRGGTGDDYPILPLAAAGFAVLSIERPPHVSTAMPDVRTWDEANAAGRRDWAERRNLLSATLAGTDLLIGRGIVDPAEVGITGLSDGAANVEFALLNSNRFAAAAISTCCDAPVTDLALGGPAWGKWNHAVMGYPLSDDDDRAFWKPLALSVSARSIRVPLLMQLADREARLAIETFTALREAGAPTEMFVFPDEYHNKWQPAHRLAIYDRDIAWFGFWLQGREPSGFPRPELGEWRAMKAGVQSGAATTARDAP